MKKKKCGAWIVLLQMRRIAARTEIAELATRDGTRTLSYDHLVFIWGISFHMIPMVSASLLNIKVLFEGKWVTSLQWAASSSPK